MYVTSEKKLVADPIKYIYSDLGALDVIKMYATFFKLRISSSIRLCIFLLSNWKKKKRNDFMLDRKVDLLPFYRYKICKQLFYELIHLSNIL